MAYMNAGLNVIRDWMVGDSATAPVSIAIGTGSTSADVSQTALVGEVFKDAFDSTSKSDRLAKFEMVLSTIEATGSTVREIGMFNSTTGTSGTMFTRNTFAAVDKTSAIEIQFEQRVEF